MFMGNFKEVLTSLKKEFLTFKLDDKEELAVGGSRAIFSNGQLCPQGTSGNVWIILGCQSSRRGSTACREQRQE